MATISPSLNRCEEWQKERISLYLLWRKEENASKAKLGAIPCKGRYFCSRTMQMSPESSTPCSPRDALKDSKSNEQSVGMCETKGALR